MLPKSYIKILFIVLCLSFLGCTKIADLAGQKDPSFLNTPQNLFAIQGVLGDSIYLSWSAVSKAKNYLIFQSSTHDGEYEQIAQSSTNYFALTNPSPKDFFYKVQAKAGATLSLESEGVQGINLDPTKTHLLKAYLMPLFLNQYVNNGDGTIKDNKTGLTWQKCSAGETGENCDEGGSASHDYASAKNYCNSLNLGGRTDWRLPEINELLTLLHDSEELPAINENFFSHKFDYHWSNTEYVADLDFAWSLFFNGGMIMEDAKTSTISVICVAP